ncbi:hypothetical protein AgCh_027862 [Apium graveolens]
MIDKDRKEYTYEDISSIMKDAKKLLNDLSLVNKEYDLEDSNLKFLPALPEKWDFKVRSIRDNYHFDITPQDEIYGVLKTHKLEIDQRSKGQGSKSRLVALNVEEKPKKKSRRKSYSKGKAMISKSDTESSNSDDDSNPDTESDTDSDHNNNEDMDQMAALLVNSFKKMIYRKFKKRRRFSRKGSSSSNSDKRNNRGNTDWKEGRSGKLNKLKERYYNCDGIEHFAADYKKPRAKKKQDFISKKRKWDDSSDSDDGINYAFMTNANIEADNAELKKSGEETEKTEPIKTDSQVKLNKFQIKTIKFNPSANNVKSIHVEGTTSTLRSNLTTEKSEQVHTNSVNIGSMTQKHLKQKLKDLQMKDKRKRSRKNKE